MPRQWVVTFEGDKPDPADDFELIFEDILEILEEIPIYKKMFFEKMVENIKNIDHYYAWENIKAIKPPEEVPFELGQYFIIIGIDKEELRYGFLMILIEDGVILAGIWPSGLAQAIKEDSKLADGIIYAFAEKPELWKEVYVVYSP